MKSNKWIAGIVIGGTIGNLLAIAAVLFAGSYGLPLDIYFVFGFVATIVGALIGYLLSLD